MGNTAGKDGRDGNDAVVDYNRLQTDLVDNQNFKTQVSSSLISDQMFKGQIIDAMKLNGNFIGPTGYTRFTELDQDSKTNLINDLVTRYKTTFGQEIINSEALQAWLIDPANSPTFRGPVGPAGKGYNDPDSISYLTANTLWCANGSCIAPKNIDLKKGQFIEFGKGEVKEQNAGKVGYQLFGDEKALDIIGAGNLPNRIVRLQDNLEVSGSINTPSLKIGDWTLDASDGHLRFKNGTAEYTMHKQESTQFDRKFLSSNGFYTGGWGIGPRSAGGHLDYAYGGENLYTMHNKSFSGAKFATNF